MAAGPAAAADPMAARRGSARSPSTLPSSPRRAGSDEVVGQVIELADMNRTTVQRPDRAAARTDAQRVKGQAEAMLRKGATKAVVAKAIGLSPSRISAIVLKERRR